MKRSSAGSSIHHPSVMAREQHRLKEVDTPRLILSSLALEKMATPLLSSLEMGYWRKKTDG